MMSEVMTFYGYRTGTWTAVVSSMSRGMQAQGEMMMFQWQDMLQTYDTLGSGTLAIVWR
jgi:hypothetical protein